MSNPIEVEALLDLARFAGPGAASRLAEGRSIFTPEDQVDLVVGRLLMEALASYTSDLDHPFGPESPTSFPQPDGIHNHSRSEEPPADLGVARQLLAKCTSIGVLIPRLQLAIREAQTMDEKAGIVAVLDRALDAHRELSDWCSRAGAYNTERAASVVGEFDELVREIKGKASGPWATADSPMHAAVELGEAKAGPEGGWPIAGRPWTSKSIGKTGVKTQKVVKRIGEAKVPHGRESYGVGDGICGQCAAICDARGHGMPANHGCVVCADNCGSAGHFYDTCACGASTVGAWTGQGVRHDSHRCARVVDTSRATGPARNPRSITNRDPDEQ